MLGLGLDERHGDRLRLRVDLDAQRVVDAPLRLLARLAADDLDGAGGLLAPDQVLGPAASVEGRIDQLGASVGLAHAHAAPALLLHQSFIFPRLSV